MPKTSRGGRYPYFFLGGGGNQLWGKCGVQHILSKNGVNMIFSPGMEGGGSRKIKLSLEVDNFFMQNSYTLLKKNVAKPIGTF